MHLKPDKFSLPIKGHPLTKGLIGCWLMNEASGIISRNAVHPVTLGILAGGTAFASSRFGSGISFDGASGTKVTMPYSAALGNVNAMSVRFVVKFNTIDTWLGIVTSINGYSPESDARIMRNADNEIHAQMATGGVAANLTTITTTVAGIWYDYVWTYDGSVQKCYLNGTYENQVVQSGVLSSDTNALLIGQGYNNGWILDGTIDHIMFWDRALSANYVRSLYRDPFQMFRRKPIELWSAAIGAVSVKVYSRGDVAALPADDTDLENAFTGGEYTQVETDDADRVAQTATGEYSAFLFKDKHTQQEQFTVTWNGQSSLAPSSSVIYLQIYNRTLSEWETLDSDNAADADTDFNLTGGKSVDLGDYFDGSFEIACRVYQQIS